MFIIQQFLEKFRCGAHALDIKHLLLSRGRLVRFTGQDRENKSDDFINELREFPSFSIFPGESGHLQFFLPPSPQLPSYRHYAGNCWVFHNVFS